MSTKPRAGAVATKPVPRPWLTPAVRGFSAASLFSDFGHELVTALLPGFLTALGGPPLAIGLVEGISSLAQAWAGLAGGRLADYSPHRRQWVVAGYFATALKALIAFVFWWPWVIVLRTAAWVGRGARGPIRNTLIAEEVPVEGRGRAYGFREAWDSAGAVLGPVAATLLVAHWGARTLMAWSAVPGLLAVAAVLLWVRDRRPVDAIPVSGRTPLSPPFRRARAALVQFQVGWVAPALFILRVERSAPGHPVELAIGLYVLHNVAYALTAFPAGALADRIGPSILLKITGLLGALTLAGWAIPGTPVLLWAFLFISAGIVTALWETVQKPWILTRLGATLQGEGFGQLSASLGVGQLVGNVLVTALWTLVGPVWAFGIAAALALQGALQLWRVDRTAAR